MDWTLHPKSTLISGENLQDIPWETSQFAFLKVQMAKNVTWWEWLVSILFPQYAEISAKLEIQALAKFIMAAWNDWRQSIFLLNQETIELRKVILPNRMALFFWQLHKEKCALVRQE